MVNPVSIMTYYNWAQFKQTENLYIFSDFIDYQAIISCGLCL